MKRLAIAALLNALLITPSFSALPVPKNLIAFNSLAGKHLLLSSKYNNSFFVLAPYFVTQKTLTYCAIASSAMLLNALNVATPTPAEYAPYSLFTQKNIFTDAVLKVVSKEDVGQHGLALETEGRLLGQFGLAVKTVFAQKSTLHDFMTQAMKALSSSKAILLVNFNRSSIGEVGSGHFSPIAAYNEKANAFLLLDVARYKYPPVWVKAKTLWASMKAKDTASHKSRGFIVASAP